jgi:predicted hydrocarbon binding protein
MKTTLIKLITRVVGFKAISFDGSHIFLWGVPMILLPADTIVLLQNRLEKEFGKKEIFSVMFGLGKLQGKNGTNILLKRYNITPTGKDLSFFLEQTGLVGMGKLEPHEKIVEEQLKEKFYRARDLNSPEAMQYKEMFGIQKTGVDFFLNGLITGGCEALFGGNLVGVEKECIACGNDKCVFLMSEETRFEKDEKLKELIPTNIKEIEEIKNKSDLTNLLEPSPMQLKDTETELSLFLKKKYKNRIFEFSNGRINMLGISGFITPMIVIALFYYVAKKRYGKKIDDIFYETGKHHGLTYGKKIIEEVNLKQNEIAIKRILETIGFFGFGKPEIMRLDLKNRKIIFKVMENPLAKEYLKIFGRQKEGIDFLLAGFTAGLIETIIGKIDVIETKCITEASPYCIFETKT